MTEVRAAEADLRAARARLQVTLGALGHRLSPKTMARDAWDETRERATDFAEGAIETVKARPAATGAVVAGIVALLARHRIAHAVGSLLHRKDKASRPTAQHRGDQS